MNWCKSKNYRRRIHQPQDNNPINKAAERNGRTMSNTTTTKRGVTHIWPRPTRALIECYDLHEYVSEWEEVLNDCGEPILNSAGKPRTRPVLIAPISEMTEAQVWAEIAKLTLGPEACDVLVAPNDRGTEFHNCLAKYKYNPARVGYIEPNEVTEKVFLPPAKEHRYTVTSFEPNGKTHTITVDGVSVTRPDYEETKTEHFIPAKKGREAKETHTYECNLGLKKDAEHIRDCYAKGEVGALVLWETWEHELTHLQWLVERCPGLPIYVFHGFVCGTEAKWGVEREGSTTWEEEFPALADIELEPPEVIVDDLIIKGNIHVVAGRFETYKTMALIELSDAILSERPAFDHFNVRQRYPVMFLCEDMSSEQFDNYAAPFDLRRHGKDFRVKKPKGGIIHAVDSSVLQQAVRGHILVLDTMLDFAKIKEAFQSHEWVTFIQRLRELMTVHGCVAVIMTAHATKSGAKAENIDPSDYLKDSVTFGGKVDIGYGFKSLSNTSQVLVERIKGRGFKRGLQFTITVNDWDGNSNLDRGRFPVCQKPGEVKRVRTAGRKVDPDKQAKLEFLKTVTGSLQEKAAALNEAFGSSHGKSTVQMWTNEFDQDKE